MNRFIPKTSFYIENEVFLKNAKQTEDDMLKFHQFITLTFTKSMMDNDMFRGILIMYDMGFGKSIISAAIAEESLKREPNRSVIVLLNKSIVGNYIENIHKYRDAILKFFFFF